MNWKKLFVASTFLVGCFLGIRAFVKACGYYLEPEYSRIFFFLPENSNSSGDKWWYCQTNISDHEHPLEEDNHPLLSDVDSVSQEWNVLLNAQFPLPDVYEAVFNSFITTDNTIQLDTLLKEREGPQKALDAIKKKAQLYEFLSIAKTNEFINVGYGQQEYDYSAEEIATRKTEYEEMKRNLAATFEALKDQPLLQSKYAFFYLKLAIATWDHSLADEMSKRLEKGSSRTLALWGKLYECEWRIKGTERNVWLAKIMTGCPSKIPRCLSLFEQKKDIDYIEAEPDSSVRAALYALQAMQDYRPDKDYLQKIASLDPHNKLLLDLVNREINKYEDYRYSSALTGYSVLADRSNPEAFEKSLQSILPVLEKLTKTSGLDNYSKEFYVLSLAHVYLLSNQEAKGVALLQTLTPVYRAHTIQKNLSLLFHYSNQSLENPSHLEQLASSIVEIAEAGSGNENVKRSLSAVLLKLQLHFEQKGDWARAGLCFLRSGMGNHTSHYFIDHSWLELNLSHSDFSYLESLLEQQDKQPFDRLLSQGIRLYDVYDSHARVYLREQKLGNAIGYLRKLPVWYRARKYNFLLDKDQFFKGTDEYESMDIVTALENLHSKVLNTEAIQDPNKKAAEYLSIATAYFELSNKGNYPYATAYYSTNTAPDSEKSIRARFPSPLYHFYFMADPSFVYFKKAQTLSTDKELSARIAYWKLRAYDQVFETQHDYEKLPKQEWIEYVQKFKNTQFYRFYPCPNIEDFLGTEFKPES